MADENTSSDEPRVGSDDGEQENNRPDDTLAESKKCPECGAPVDDVRATCINCGYEYSDEDHENTDAGNEFLIGSQVDDEGKELPYEEPDQDQSGDERPKSEE